MERTKINQLHENIGKKVLLKGWIHESRDQSKIKFILLRDISGVVQLVVKENTKDIFSTITKIPKESVISIEGTVKEANISDREVSEKKVEIIVEKYEVLSEADKLPIPVVEGKGIVTDLSKRLDFRWIDLRKPKNALIFKIQTTMEMAMRKYWIKEGFMEIHSPKLMCSPSETGAELFPVIYFDKEAFLAQSPQFYKQMAMASGFEKIFEVGPVFRANPSHTVRHDTEFTSMDVEISWVNSQEEVMKSEEELLAFAIQEVKELHGKEIKEAFGIELEVPKLPFPRMSLKEAKDLLKAKGKEVSYEEDLNPEEEKLVAQIVKEKFNHDFVFVTEFPWRIKPFYHMRKETDPSVTKGFDLLWNGL